MVAEELVRVARMLTSKMKITPEDYEILEGFLNDVVRKAGKAGLADYKVQLENNPKIKDVDKAFRWGLLNASKIKIGDGRGMSGDVALYGYMNDNQIDTALRFYIRSKRL